MKKPPPGLVTSRSKPPRRPHPHHHPHPQRHHPGRKPGPAGVRATNPLLPGRPLPAHKHKAPKHKKAKKPVKRKLALGEDVACCAAEALAASLRLAGYSVADEDVLALYWRTAADADAGAAISATLEAAAEFGLAGARPYFEEVGKGPTADALPFRGLSPAWTASRAVDHLRFTRVAIPAYSPEALPCRRLIIGVTLPGGPHALTLDPSGAVWSWGEMYDLSPDVAIEEAWEVTWC